jgi:glycerophosphoryl diester phosphodiesterase
MIMDFNKSIFEYRLEKGSPLLVAHRGICGANIPCNTLAAFKIALDQGADVIELDVSISKDGEFFVFHPGTEPVFLKCGKYIKDMTADEVKSLRLLNQDEVPTSYAIPTLAEAFEFLKGKAYINVDKFWTDVKGISEVIRRCGVEKQVIVKTFTDESSLNAVVEYAPEFMFMPLVSGNDTVTDMLIEKGVNVIGAEVLFKTEQDEVISDEYIEKMHAKKLLIWANSIVYNEKAVISAYRTDDISLTDSPDRGWGWLIDKKVDLIQTDWLLPIKYYIDSRKQK